MRIGFNAQRLAGRRLGVGRYIEYVVLHWAAMLAAWEQVVLYLRQPLDADGALDLPPTRWVFSRVSPYFRVVGRKRRSAQLETQR